MEKYMENISLDWSEDSVRLINTPSQKAKSIYYYMQEAGYFKTTPPYFTERMGLPSFLILYTISGEGILTYNGCEFSLSTGDCFFINCMDHHKYYVQSESATDSGINQNFAPKWEFLWIHFYGSNSLGYYQEFVRNGFDVLHLNTEENCNSISNILRQIISMYQEKMPDTELYTSKLLTDLMTFLCMTKNHTSVSERNIGASYSMPDYVKLAMNYLDKHFQSDISLDQLSAQCGISKFHLSREFSKYVDLTINEYLISKRIHHAKELLKYTAVPICEIAFACGMHNVSHFINLFKAREGMTPLKYRQSWGQ